MNEWFVAAPGPCMACGRMTENVEVCWEVHLCNDECAARADREAGEYLAGLPDVTAGDDFQ